MAEMQELIEKPLSPDELATRYRAMCDDPCFANVLGKVELDVWGRVLMSQASSYHGLIQGRLVHKLKSVLGGEVITEAPIVTPGGLFLPDVSWASSQFVSAHRSEIALTRAREICIEVFRPQTR
ncbi:MAG TPA: hypothetical protein VFJ70_23760 [Burkholderiales bacterium]|nr:hypothetical protein [Burkholderiales bacterium]